MTAAGAGEVAVRAEQSVTSAINRMFVAVLSKFL